MPWLLYCFSQELLKLSMLPQIVRRCSLPLPSICDSIRYFSSNSIKEDKNKHTPFGSSGSSLYSSATKGCFDVIDNATPLVLDCIDELVSDRNNLGLSDSAFNIADFGTADGGTSIRLMHKIISRIRTDKHHKYTPICIHYEDQPNNDWNSLFNNVQNRNNNKIQLDPNGYYTEQFDDIFVLVSGTSFYQQCFLPNSIDFIFSSTAMHWISSTPCNIPNALHSAMLPHVDEIKQKYAKQATDDWNTILLHRSNELKYGGKMVIVNFCVDEHGQYLGNTFMDNQQTINMHQLFCDSWIDLLSNGIIDEDEFHNTNFANHYRTLDEMKCFDASRIPLNITQIFSDVVPCPFYSSFMRNEGNQSAEEYAANYLPTLRTWSNSTFLNGLKESRSKEAKVEIVDRFFDSYLTKIVEDPTKHRMDYVHGYVVFEKNAISDFF